MSEPELPFTPELREKHVERATFTRSTTASVMFGSFRVDFRS
jgi:hypothetical protein